MFLVADSGSTSTNWRLISQQGELLYGIDTMGLNPYHLTKSEISDVIQSNVKNILDQHFDTTEINHVYFYGAGCSTPNKKAILEDCLSSIFQNADISVNHDIMGSAIASCQNDKGIACILGTGSNSCVYDGEKIIKNLPSLGFMLGDEGSGTYIGKKILQLFLKGKFSENLNIKFNQKYGLSSEDILNRIYQKENPAAFIAQFSHFAMENIQEDVMKQIIKSSFDDFFTELVLPYPESEIYPINFVGSIAASFEPLLREVGKNRNLNIHRIIQYPINELVAYHTKQLKKDN